MAGATNMKVVDKFTTRFAESKARRHPNDIRAWDRYFDCFEHRFEKIGLEGKRKMMVAANKLTSEVSECGGKTDTRLGITYLAIKSGDFGTEEIFSWIKDGVCRAMDSGLKDDAHLLIRVAYDELDANNTKDVELLVRLGVLAKRIGCSGLAEQIDDYLEVADKDLTGRQQESAAPIDPHERYEQMRDKLSSAKDALEREEVLHLGEFERNLPSDYPRFRWLMKVAELANECGESQRTISILDKAQRELQTISYEEMDPKTSTLLTQLLFCSDRIGRFEFDIGESFVRKMYGYEVVKAAWSAIAEMRKQKPEDTVLANLEADAKEIENSGYLPRFAEWLYGAIKESPEVGRVIGKAAAACWSGMISNERARYAAKEAGEGHPCA
jgi:hypothetical protein